MGSGPSGRSTTRDGGQARVTPSRSSTPEFDALLRRFDALVDNCNVELEVLLQPDVGECRSHSCALWSVCWLAHVSACLPGLHGLPQSCGPVERPRAALMHAGV